MFIRKMVSRIEAHLKLFTPSCSFYVAVTGLEGRLAHMSKVGFAVPPVAGERLVPFADFGIASRRNADGDEIVHKDQPLETHHRQREWTSKEFRGRYDQDKLSKRG